MSDALTPEATSELRAWAERFDDEYARDALAEIDRLRAEIATRDRQLAELREACQPLADAMREFAEHSGQRSADTISGLMVPADPLRRLAALLPPTAKEEPRAETKD